MLCGGYCGWRVLPGRDSVARGGSGLPRIPLSAMYFIQLSSSILLSSAIDFFLNLTSLSNLDTLFLLGLSERFFVCFYILCLSQRERC